TSTASRSPTRSIRRPGRSCAPTTSRRGCPTWASAPSPSGRSRRSSARPSTTACDAGSRATSAARPAAPSSTTCRLICSSSGREPSKLMADAPALHRALIDALVSRRAIKDLRVEAAFRAIPRHLFLPDVPLAEAYRNEAIPTKLADGEAISSSSQPEMMAIMLEQLALEPGLSVLEIGAGTGYNAALMAHIVGESGAVVTMDVDADLVHGARAHLAAAGLERVRVVLGDGGLGDPDGAP